MEIERNLTQARGRLREYPVIYTPIWPPLLQGTQKYSGPEKDRSRIFFIGMSLPYWAFLIIGGLYGIALKVLLICFWGAVKYVAGFALSLIVLELRYRALFPYTKGPCTHTVQTIHLLLSGQSMCYVM